MQRSRTRLYGATLAALAGLTITGSATFAAVWNGPQNTSWIAGPNDVINSTAAVNASGWAGWSDAGPVQVSRQVGLTGKAPGTTALSVTRDAGDGTWGEVLGDLNAPDAYFVPGKTYRMSVWVRDLTASGRQVGMLIANGNYVHRPSNDSVYQGFNDTNWHQLSKTFVATDRASADTKFYLGLPSTGAINMQLTAAEVVSLVTPTSTSTAGAKATSVPTSTSTTAAPVTAPTSSSAAPKPATTTSTTTAAPAPASSSASSAVQPVRVVTFNGAAGTAPSSADWNYELGGGGWGNNELETYTNSTANSYVDGNGHLVITARRQTVTGSDGITRNYTSARLSTAGKVVVQPGSYVESSITAPVGTGVWPAFWTIGTNVNQVGWPRSGEIDILEGTGAHPTWAQSNLHVSRLSNPDQDNQTGWGYSGATQYLPTALDAGPHTYGVYFDANVAKFYIDRQLTWQYTAAEAAASDRAWPFNGAQYLILNVAVDGDPSATSFPRSMTVGPIGIYNRLPF